MCVFVRLRICLWVLLRTPIFSRHVYVCISSCLRVLPQMRHTLLRKCRVIRTPSPLARPAQVDMIMTAPTSDTRAHLYWGNLDRLQAPWPLSSRPSSRWTNASSYNTRIPQADDDARMPSFYNTVPLHSSKHASQRLNRRNRGLVLVARWSKELILIKVCRG